MLYDDSLNNIKDILLIQSYYSLLFVLQDKIEHKLFINNLCSLIKKKKCEFNINRNIYYFLSKSVKNCDYLSLNDLLNKAKKFKSFDKKLFIIEEIENLDQVCIDLIIHYLDNIPDNFLFIFISYKINKKLLNLMLHSIVFRINITFVERVEYLSNLYKNMTTNNINNAIRMSRGNLSVVNKIKQDKIFWSVRSKIFIIFYYPKKIFLFSHFFSNNFKYFIYWFSSFLIDLYYIISGVSLKYIANYDKLDCIYKFSKIFSINCIYNYYSKVLRFEYLYCNNNINSRIFIEYIMFDFMARADI